MAGVDSGDAVFADALDRVVAELGLSLEPDARRKMLEHYRLLRVWNQRMNLTRVREPREIAERHFGEAIFLIRQVGGTAGTVIDVGSGAGFPGLPVAALLPKTEVTLVESVQRKAVFLREASRSWGNVEVRNERFERLSGDWNLSTMRAVAVSGALTDLARVSERTAVLMGEEGLKEALRAPEFIWEEPVALPWGARRVLLMGRRASQR